MVENDSEVEFPAYLAMSADQLTIDSVQIFSPYAMHWDDGIWLLDMRGVVSYWLNHLVRGRMSVTSLLRSKMVELCNDSGQFFCVGSRHPWRALLTLLTMRERSVYGVVLEYESFGRRLYQQVSWAVWWRSLSKIGERFIAQKAKGFSGEKYAEQCGRMREILPRMGRNNLFQFSNIDSSNIRRRFGRYLEAIWIWTFDRGGSIEAILFPWQTAAASSNPFVQRCLDFPLLEWDHIESFLIEDFDRLCLQATQTENYLVLGLEWRLVFSDSSILPLPIAFRHPHLLSKEMQQHRTALLQAKYAFEGCEKERRKNYAEFRAIASWDLVITERLQIGYSSSSLFHDEFRDFERLDELENKLPVRLYAYRVNHDWLPEHSYEIEDQRIVTPAHQIGLDQWSICAAQRPLFIYRSPIVYQENCFGPGSWFFLERSMNKWWLSSDHALRHYYRVIHRNQQTLWIYRTENGKYFIQGNYA